jgi:hypothetical protein
MTVFDDLKELSIHLPAAKIVQIMEFTPMVCGATRKNPVPACSKLLIGREN